MRISWLLFLFFSPWQAWGQYCAEYNTNDLTTPFTISDATHHITGSHSLKAAAANACTYSDSKIANQVCIVQELLAGYGTRNEQGIVTDLGGHDLAAGYPPTTVRTQGSSHATVQIEFAVQGCGILGCLGGVTFNFPPFSVTGPSVIFKQDSPVSDFCAQHYNNVPRGCYGQCGTPLMADLSQAFGGDESGTDIFHLTDKEHGIRLKFKRGQGQDWAEVKPESIGWTEPNSYMAVLVRPNANGDYTIENSDNVFGNYSSCGDKLCKNGVAALAYYCDDPINGGNGDGVCDSKDLHFQNGDLRWQVGRTRLLTMKEAKVTFLGLTETEMHGTFRRQDQFGNIFALRSIMRFESRDPHITRDTFVWDVIPDQKRNK